MPNQSDFKFQELIDEELYCLIAPDGTPQFTVCAPDYAMCVAVAELFYDVGISQSVSDLIAQGYSIAPIKMSITLNGNPSSLFSK